MGKKRAIRPERPMLDVEAVGQIIEQLQQAGQSVEQAAKLFELQLMILKTSAFKGQVSSAAHEQFVEQSKPQLEELSSWLQGLYVDLEAARNSLTDEN